MNAVSITEKRRFAGVLQRVELEFPTIIRDTFLPPDHVEAAPKFAPKGEGKWQHVAVYEISVYVTGNDGIRLI